jgi:hypothetical protein
MFNNKPVTDNKLSETLPPVEIVKLPKTPKEPRFRKGLTQEAWQAKLASITVAEIPAGWVGMAEICKAARDQNPPIKISRVCTAMGGDRALGEPWDPIFQVKYVGGRKYGSPEILTKGFALLQDPEYHKAIHKGRKPAEKDADGKVIKVKPASTFKA